jgi:hypothetical protein
MRTEYSEKPHEGTGAIRRPGLHGMELVIATGDRGCSAMTMQAPDSVSLRLNLFRPPFHWNLRNPLCHFSFSGHNAAILVGGPS